MLRVAPTTPHSVAGQHTQPSSKMALRRALQLRGAAALQPLQLLPPAVAAAACASAPSSSSGSVCGMSSRAGGAIDPIHDAAQFPFAGIACNTLEAKPRCRLAGSVRQAAKAAARAALRSPCAHAQLLGLFGSHSRRHAGMRTGLNAAAPPCAQAHRPDRDPRPVLHTYGANLPAGAAGGRGPRGGWRQVRRSVQPQGVALQQAGACVHGGVQPPRDARVPGLRHAQPPCACRVQAARSA